MELIPVKEIQTHHLNPNLMSPSNLKKLKMLIEEEKNYPPLIVNKKEDGYLLLDGHQRMKVLRDLGYDKVKCDIWEVDEKTELILLATLNKLKGQSIGEKKQQLYDIMKKTIDNEKLKKIISDQQFQNQAIQNTVKESKEREEEDQVQVQQRAMFVNHIEREKFEELNDFLGRYMNKKYIQEAVYWIMKLLKCYMAKESPGAELKTAFIGAFNGVHTDGVKKDTV